MPSQRCSDTPSQWHSVTTLQFMAAQHHDGVAVQRHKLKYQIA
jgi:hypothetical protein